MLAVPKQAVPDISSPLPSGGSRCLVLPGMAPNSTNTRALADRIYYEPWYVMEAITIDALVMEVTTFAASSVIRQAIYLANTAWQPTTLIVDAGTVSSASNGVKTASFTGVRLQPGRYLCAKASDGAPTVRFVRYNPLGQMSLHSTSTSPLTSSMHTSAGGAGTGAATSGFASTGVAWDADSTDSAPLQVTSFARLAVA